MRSLPAKDCNKARPHSRWYSEGRGWLGDRYGRRKLFPAVHANVRITQVIGNNQRMFGGFAWTDAPHANQTRTVQLHP